MSETKTRKAVVTMEQVRDAFQRFTSAHVLTGEGAYAEHEFDKGMRGKGFAEYDHEGRIVHTFESKDDALAHYSGIAEGMWRVLDALANDSEVRESLIEWATTDTESAQD